MGILIYKYRRKLDRSIGNILIKSINSLFNQAPDCHTVEDPKNILLIKFWGIGNLVMLTPSIKAVKKRFPNAKLHFLTLSTNVGLLENLDYVDEVLYHNIGYSDIFKIFTTLFKYHKKFDIVIDFEPFLNISSIISYFLGKYRIGFKIRTRERHRLFDCTKDYVDDRHLVEQWYGLSKLVGFKEEDIRLESFTSFTENKKVDDFIAVNEIQDNNLIGVHLGSSDNARVRQWPIDYFVELINLLNNKFDNLSFVITGIESDKRLAEYVISKVNKDNCHSSCGLFDIKELIHFIKKCDLYVSSDTGPIHIAAACGITCVGLYGPNSPLLYGPFGKNHLVFYKHPDCSPCLTNYNEKTTTCKKALCLEHIKPKEVADKIIDHIQTNK
ncbi:glycosyltransferase family 9 protein [Candidatus Pacearchaeota archaeon]|nr:glycosyltransferase family 9 protein [Candidatus Pacearchaeota archaeon]